MKVRSLNISDVKLIEPEIFKDERGYFYESFNHEKFFECFKRKNLFLQDNQSFSKKNVLRGLHFQKPPKEQGKLVRVISGEVFDVAVDLRKTSKTYGKWVAQILSSENHLQLWIPEGFAHGFYCLKDSIVQYKTNALYSFQHEDSIKWNDPQLAINWPIKSEPYLSSKDQNSKFFCFNEFYFK